MLQAFLAKASSNSLGSIKVGFKPDMNCEVDNDLQNRKVDATFPHQDNGADVPEVSLSQDQIENKTVAAEDKIPPAESAAMPEFTTEMGESLAKSFVVLGQSWTESDMHMISEQVNLPLIVVQAWYHGRSLNKSGSSPTKPRSRKRKQTSVPAVHPSTPVRSAETTAASEMETVVPSPKKLKADSETGEDNDNLPNPLVTVESAGPAESLAPLEQPPTETSAISLATLWQEEKAAKEAKRLEEKAAKEAKKAEEQAAREAKRLEEQAAREAKRLEEQAAREAKKAAAAEAKRLKELAKEAERLAKEQQQEARRKAKEAEKERKEAEKLERQKQLQAEREMEMKEKEKAKMQASSLLLSFIKKEDQALITESKAPTEKVVAHALPHSIIGDWVVSLDTTVAAVCRVSEEEKQQKAARLQAALQSGESPNPVDWCSHWKKHAPSQMILSPEAQAHLQSANRCVGGKLKFLSFHENRRPAYFGTWSRPCHTRSLQGGRCPFARESSLDYEVESDDEWEDEPEDGEDLEDDLSGDEEGKDGLGEGEEEEGGEDFVVPDGYLSDEEGLRAQREEEEEEDDDNDDDVGGADGSLEPKTPPPSKSATRQLLGLPKDAGRLGAARIISASATMGATLPDLLLSYQGLPFVEREARQGHLMAKNPSAALPKHPELGEEATMDGGCDSAAAIAAGKAAAARDVKYLSEEQARHLVQFLQTTGMQDRKKLELINLYMEHVRQGCDDPQPDAVQVAVPRKSAVERAFVLLCEWDGKMWQESAEQAAVLEAWSERRMQPPPSPGKGKQEGISESDKKLPRLPTEAAQQLQAFALEHPQVSSANDLVTLFCVENRGLTKAQCMRTLKSLMVFDRASRVWKIRPAEEETPATAAVTDVEEPKAVEESLPMDAKDKEEDGWPQDIVRELESIGRATSLAAWSITPASLLEHLRQGRAPPNEVLTLLSTWIPSIAGNTVPEGCPQFTLAADISEFADFLVSFFTLAHSRGFCSDSLMAGLKNARDCRLQELARKL